jgi:hypothetical protein
MELGKVFLTTKVCSNEDQWQCFPEQFKNSIHKADKILYKYLTNDLIPLVIRDLEAARVAREQKKIRIQQEKEAYEEMLKAEAEYAKKMEEEKNEQLAREMERKELARGVATRSKKNFVAPAEKTAAEVIFSLQRFVQKGWREGKSDYLNQYPKNFVLSRSPRSRNLNQRNTIQKKKKFLKRKLRRMMKYRLALILRLRKNGLLIDSK